MTGCASGGDQSGVLLEIDGEVGILTALHGVVPCFAGDFNIFNPSALCTGQLRSVDIARDLAFLSCQSAQLPEPLTLGDRELPALADATVAGYPLLMQMVRGRQVTTAKPPYSRIDATGAINNVALTDRVSPAPSTRVLHINGPVARGDSGGPVISDGQVVGIVNGGMSGGLFGMAWAISTTDGIDLQPKENQLPELRRISVMNLSDLSGFAARSATEMAGKLPCAESDEPCWAVWFSIAGGMNDALAGFVVAPPSRKVDINRPGYGDPGAHKSARNHKFAIPMPPGDAKYRLRLWLSRPFRMLLVEWDFNDSDTNQKDRFDLKHEVDVKSLSGLFDYREDINNVTRLALQSGEVLPIGTNGFILRMFETSDLGDSRILRLDVQSPMWEYLNQTTSAMSNSALHIGYAWILAD
ncbi:trypsin-like peptidase domain-containing protein [Rhodothermus sp. AH-315-K08]|nr:trypsin-like peptidase domain-containing protein [Rhodothermus sp. AH-315-K08]